MKKAIGILALLVVGASSLNAQQLDASGVNTVALIDGSQHPEQIPQQVILRLWLLQYTSETDPIIPLEMGLNADDSSALTWIMSNFKTQHARHVAMYGSMPGVNFDTDQQDQYGLVSVTWNAIQAGLSATGLAHFSAYIERAKGGAKVSPYDYGLGTVGARNRREATMVASRGGFSMDGPIPAYSNLLSTNVVYTGGSALDSFQTAGAPGTNWRVRYGSFNVGGNGVYVTSGGGLDGRDALMYYNSSFSADQCSTIILGTVPTQGGEIGPAIRISATSESYYVAMYTQQALYLVKLVNGVQANLVSAAYTAAAGDSISICAAGTTLVAAVNRNQLKITTTDSSISSGYPGVQGHTTVGVGTAAGWNANGTISLQVMNMVHGASICHDGCPGIPRTYYATNTNGTLGGTRSFPNQEASTCGAVNNNVTYPLSLLSTTIPTITLNDWVYAPDLGVNVWQGVDTPTAHLQVELAYTMTVSTGGGFSGAWQVTPKCVVAYTPPDYNPTIMFGKSPTPFTTYFGEGICARVASATPWLCVGGISWGVNLTLPPANCNRYDAGNRGFMIIE